MNNSKNENRKKPYSLQLIPNNPDALLSSTASQFTLELPPVQTLLINALDLSISYISNKVEKNNPDSIITKTAKLEKIEKDVLIMFVAAPKSAMHPNRITKIFTF